MSDLLEYFVVKKIKTDQSEIKSAYEVHKYTEHREPDSIGVVRLFKSGRFDSDDCGFLRHGNELANKRIRVVKEHILLGEPSLTSYWHNEKGEVEHHTTDVLPLYKD